MVALPAHVRSAFLDFFPDDFITIIDESHVTVSQIRGMYGGDRSRKQTLVEYGFRLPSALDNRPLKFDEFESLTGQTIYVSATPGDYEMQQTQGVYVEQLIRPTGLLDPKIEVRPCTNQVDDLVDEIIRVIARKQRVLVTTLTKRMAEELTNYLNNLNINTRYIHSDVDTLDRVEIMMGLRRGDFDVLVGVNLLREGLDLPEVQLVAILDADKEGFLRSERSLTQTAGRAARNAESKVIMYADKITDSMRKTIDETQRRREKQMAYNIEHNIVPKTIIKPLDNAWGDLNKGKLVDYEMTEEHVRSVAEEKTAIYRSPKDIKKSHSRCQERDGEIRQGAGLHECCKIPRHNRCLRREIKQNRLNMNTLAIPFFATDAVWNAMIQFGIIAVGLLAGNIVRTKVPFMQKSLIPSALIGGALILVFKAIYSDLLGWEDLIDKRSMEIITYHALGLGFVALALKNNKVESKSSTMKVIETGTLTASTYIIQGIVGLLVTIPLFYFGKHIFYAAGLLLPMGYGQGPGQALNFGTIYMDRAAEQGIDFPGKDFGLSIAAMGFIIGCVVGVIYLNILKKKGKIKISEIQEKQMNKLSDYESEERNP